MIFFTGVGSRRTRVGTAMIWSPLASLGRSRRSITWILYARCRCSSQIFFRFSKARIEVGVIPATYKRNSHTGGLNGAGESFSAEEFLRLPGADCLLVAIDQNSFVAQSEAVH